MPAATMARRRRSSAVQGALLAGAACLLILQSSSAFLGGAPQSTGRLTAFPQASAALEPVKAPAPVSTSSATGVACGVGSVALLLAYASLRSKPAARAKRRVHVTMAAQSAAAPSILLQPPQAEISSTPATQSVCLMMSEMEVKEVMPVIECQVGPAIFGAEARCLRSASVKQVARLVGGARYSKHRGFSRAGARRARRHCGARLLQSANQVLVAPQPYDLSQVRLKIQIGLAASTQVRTESGRERRNLTVNTGICTGSDARIQEKDLVEHLTR